MLIACLSAAQLSNQGTPPGRSPVTIRDCIEMTRIQQTYSEDDRTATFSPDGKLFATLIWRGDIAKNVNRYTVLVFDADNLSAKPRALLTAEYSHDQSDQHARPVSNMRFLPGNKTLAFLGTLKGEPRQVYVVDLAGGAPRALTRHPTNVRAFALAREDGPFLFGADAPDDRARRDVLIRDGFSINDRTKIGALNMGAYALGNWFEPRTEFFFTAKRGLTPTRVHQVAGAPARIWISPAGDRALVYPFQAASDRVGFGMFTLANGAVSPVALDAGGRVGSIAWAHDGRSVLAGSGGTGGLTLTELDLTTGRSGRLPIEGDWSFLGWDSRTGRVRLVRNPYARDQHRERLLGTVEKLGATWSAVRTLGSESKFSLNRRYGLAMAGRLIVGVKDSITVPPELAVYDTDTRETRILTDLNPQLRDRSFGEVTRITWDGPYDKGTSFGWVIKPVGFEPGKRYPLVIQFKDEGYYPEDDPFIIDGPEQYSGAAIQPLANSGFVVLYTPAALSTRERVTTPDEGKHQLAHVESGIEHLDRLGLIDRQRIAITGWSRAGWWTDYIVAHASFPILAATEIDNVQYDLNRYVIQNGEGSSWEDMVKNWGGTRPWGPDAAAWHAQAIDWKIERSWRTAFLTQTHGPLSILRHQLQFAARKTLGIPAEFYVYFDASHSTKSPRHRLGSLSTHVDWFRFWLQGYEDPDPAKRAQYERWQKMRDTRYRPG
jgi:dipeptidyl aminopeptidase/acylaminoacyl peptidase